jgi:hypothetical protein
MKYWERKEKLFKYIDGVRQFFPRSSGSTYIQVGKIILKWKALLKLKLYETS